MQQLVYWMKVHDVRYQVWTHPTVTVSDSRQVIINKSIDECYKRLHAACILRWEDILSI